jgi:hypothetical protein
MMAMIAPVMVITGICQHQHQRAQGPPKPANETSMPV